jgi:putative aldouronate transport system permease protein
MLRRMLIRGATGDVVQGNYSDTLQAKSFFRQVKMATVIVTTAPILLVYPFVQKYFVRGTLVGAIKG